MAPFDPWLSITTQDTLHSPRQPDEDTMLAAPPPSNEATRLRTLREYAILDTAPEPQFDDLTRLAA